MKAILCATVLLLFCTSKAAAATESADPWTSQWKAPDLNEISFRHWINFVRPNADELKWKKIGWRVKFESAVEEARRLQRPILLWTMNGHPLGCT